MLLFLILNALVKNNNQAINPKMPIFEIKLGINPCTLVEPIPIPKKGFFANDSNALAILNSLTPSEPVIGPKPTNPKSLEV